jgi:cysteine desulfuration protein SufE
MASTPNTIHEAQQDIIETFELLEDWYARFEHIIELGKGLEPFPEAHRLDANKVSGCQSQVWLIWEARDGKVYYQADSDSTLVKGLIALLLSVYSGRTPKEILETPPEFIKQTGMIENLSPNRANGLGSMVKHLLDHATEAAKAAG